MTKIMMLPRDHMTLGMMMEGGLDTVSDNLTVSHDINELSEAIKDSHDESHIVVTDLGWDDGYQLLIRDFARVANERQKFLTNHPVILFSNTGYTPKDMGVVGTLRTAETYGEFTNGTGLEQNPSILSRILNEAIKGPVTDLTVERFKELKASAKGMSQKL